MSPFSLPVDTLCAMTCPLCHFSQTHFYHQDKRRRYQQCAQCQLVFVEPEFLPNAQQEKHEYDLHENHAEDEGYRRFLNKLAAPLNQVLQPNSNGLDFGCGPTPLLANMLSKSGGHSMHVFDPNYYPNRNVLAQQYDFISCSEAIEHFHTPYREWQIFLDCLKPGGWIGIMTKRVLSKEKFTNWHYKNDITHVSFFSEATFRWLAERDNLSMSIVSNDVILLQKLA